ncbi:hypothetical protein GPJ56_002085 [Histomonas meleagridis]|uniref:uncharacterized protein n=1 Tax=Histomonas meleagridis TaxID=135588 RepID=UPI0035593F98|nr:hypothetical protein GPJ56_002085 [Histomonas meleagridis]KAH0803637.1 hypothetical protein GO595_003602 [Histomonas meleagridis]
MISTEQPAPKQVHITKKALQQLTVKSRETNLQYLRDLDDEKPMSERLLSYFLQLEIISSTSNTLNSWSEHINKLITNYSQFHSHYCKDLKISEITPLLEPIIPRDLPRSLGIFDEFQEILLVPKTFFTEYELRFYRIFLILSKESPTFRYAQGMDRFLYLSTIISIQFCQELNLDVDVCESLTYFLFKGLINKVYIGNIALDQELSKDLFLRMAVVMVKCTPIKAGTLARLQIKPEMFALNYVLLLFMDQHPLKQLLIIWDQILLNVERCEAFIISLVVAHINQIEIKSASQADEMQRIMKEKDFFLQRLVYEANLFVETADKLKDGKDLSEDEPLNIWKFVVPIVVIVVVGVVLFKFTK